MLDGLSRERLCAKRLRMNSEGRHDASKCNRLTDAQEYHKIGTKVCFMAGSSFVPVRARVAPRLSAGTAAGGSAAGIPAVGKHLKSLVHTNSTGSYSHVVKHPGCQGLTSGTELLSNQPSCLEA